jgi:Xaa-Pro aminopeptidase
VSGPDYGARLRRLRQDAASAGAPVVLITNPVNVTYLSGFAGSAGMLLVTSDRAVLLVDGRYEAAARAVFERTGFEGEAARVEGGYDAALGALASRIGAAGIAFEAEAVTVQQLSRWKTLLDRVEWVPTERLVGSRRAVKDAFEIERLRDAGRRLSEIARLLPQWVRPGRTERNVAAEILQALDRAGFSGPAFPPIVAGGPNSAYPHARPTDRRLSDGDLVTLDFGGVLDGYCGDLTRVCGIGRVTDAARNLYDVVRSAHGAAVAAVRPGVLGSEVDRAARSVFEAAGLAQAFLHSTGHGLGLEVHEAPRLGRAGSPDDEPLVEGMVATVEPGAYVEGLAGARLEDDVLVTAGGCQLLTDAPRELLVV